MCSAQADVRFVPLKWIFEVPDSLNSSARVPAMAGVIREAERLVGNQGLSLFELGRLFVWQPAGFCPVKYFYEECGAEPKISKWSTP